ncbi:tRNA-dihydrouridine(20) synthase [NAD(P)+] [Zalerion maritima]|uniref:tRNA-dihydrouridine(20) synthase [NAD(P)+] n=1 Tax=Zalerion maritima TaxID=339359 RepID=A0AAD5WU59_9PEZI|nr:tRNA-dihydrouridine(20) synthase [NAD(P)+] [Zalerion maritima]
MAPTPKKVPIPPRGVDYRDKIVLAPMVRSGELPSRLTALHYGADLVWGPETVDRAMIGATRRINPDTNIVEWVRIPHFGQKQPPPNVPASVIFQVHPSEQCKKLVYQIGTSDPDRAVEAARMVAADVAGIDVNAGCPKPFSTSGGMGAALLKTPDKLCAILEALVNNIVPEFEIGISVKMRLLETAAETETLVRRLCGTGITGLTVHCRTTPMRPREPAIRGQLRMVADICREAGVACLMNGDVESRDHAKKLIEEFGVDGAMMARAAETNPSCFRPEAEGGFASWQDAVEKYLQNCMTTYNRFGNTKYLLCNMVPGKWPGFKNISQSKSYTQVIRTFGLSHLEKQAMETDAKLGIDPESTAPRKGKKRKNQAPEGRPDLETKKQKVSNGAVTGSPNPKMNGNAPSSVLDKEQPVSNGTATREPAMAAASM